MQQDSSLQRPRRLRSSPLMRELVAETAVEARSLVMPHSVLPSSGRAAIASMPGIERVGREQLLHDVESDLELGIKSVLLFGLAAEGHKSPAAEASKDPSGVVQQAVSTLKAEFGDEIFVICDVCLCAYTDHGHCGLIEGGRVLNDASLPALCDMAVSLAEAGADMVAPSDMMDGRVRAIRRALDSRGLEDTALMSYAVKYASAYYGPFRDAADSAPGQGDRKSYQMDPRNAREALREAQLDEAEGADILMVKPALAYLDIIAELRRASNLPLAAYHVSGEYSAIKAAAERGWLDEPRVVAENLVALRRAGADILITYYAREALRGAWL